MDFRLYTIEACGRRVAVISAGVIPSFEDNFGTNPKMLRVSRLISEMQEQLDDDARHIGDMAEIDEALATWLGEDLMCLTSGGQPLWNGHSEQLHVREASPEETRVWNESLEEAVRTGEQDAGEKDWIAYLLPVSDPTDENDDEDEDDL